jgi:hypothetical protein
VISVKDLIHHYCPGENILEERGVRLTDSLWLVKAGKVPLSGSKVFYLKPVTYVETDMRYYFDLRGTMQYQNKLTFITSPLLFCGFVYLVSLFVWKISIQPVVYLFIVIFSLIPSIINIRIFNGLLGIKVIDKKWISASSNEADKTVLKGNIPAGENYMFPYINDISVPLPLSERIYSGLFWGKWVRKLFVGGEFTVSFRPE